MQSKQQPNTEEDKRLVEEKRITPGDRKQRRANKKLSKKANQHCIRLCSQYLRELKNKGLTLEDEEVVEIFDKYEKSWKHWLVKNGAKPSVKSNEMFQNYLQMFIDGVNQKKQGEAYKEALGNKTPKPKKKVATKPKAKK